MHFLFAMWDGGGSVPPELGVARRLIARGHQATVIADPTIDEEARAAGCAFTPWITAPHATTRAPGGAVFLDYEYRNPLAGFKKARDSFLCGPAAAFAADVRAALGRTPYDGVISCAMLPGALIAGEASGLPTIALLPNIYMYPAEGMPAMGPGFLPARGPWGRARDRVMGGLFTRLFDKGLPAINNARAQMGLSPLTHVFDQNDRADAMLVLTAACFDFPATLPANVKYCGPILDDPFWAGPWASPWPADDPRPLVMVSLSSGYQAQEDVIRRASAALGDLKVRAVITTGQALDPRRFTAPPNIRVVASAPHQVLLPQARAIVTHCGHGTTMKALVHGVPLVCVPMGRDQNDTAARVVARGAGIRLPPSASAQRLRAAVEAVLTNGSYRDGAIRLGKAITEEAGGVDIAADIERVVTSRDERGKGGAKASLV